MFIELLEYLLDLFYDFTSSYGLAIILLSFLINFSLLPIFFIADQIGIRHSLKRLHMKPLLDKISNIKNSREKFYYQKEIYRKKGYSPIESLLGSFSLIFQIPFFIGIYLMLINYSIIENISFGPIEDISRPDKLIIINGLEINLLPFVMTLINLVGLHFISKNIDKSQKIQLSIIAFIFLILLYNLPSSLLIYWTSNNIFSLFKDFIFNNLRKTQMESFLIKKLKKINQNLKVFYKKKWLYISLLCLSLSPLLSLYVSNLNQLYYNKTPFLILFFIVFLFTIITTIIFNRLIKKIEKAHVFSFTFFAFFFLFGHLIDLFKYTIFYKDSISVVVFTIITTILFIGLIFIILFTKRNIEGVSNILNVLSILLFLIVFTRISFQNSYDSNINETYQKSSRSSSVDNSEFYPDIYYIILDAYANSEILKKEFNYDNKTFENYLNQRDFFIVKNSFSNYHSTFLSLASTLNMRYVNFLKDSLGVNSSDRGIPNKMIKNNRISKYLKNKGYNIVNFKSSFAPTHKNEIADFNLSEKIIIDDFTSNFLQTTILRPLFALYYRDNIRQNVNYMLSEIPKLGYITSPKFIFAHFLSPHPPYVFDENGGKLSRSIRLNDWDERDREYYLGQLKYVNKKLEYLIKEILDKSKDDIIIIQSDHGPAFNGKDYLLNANNPTKEFLKERGKTFNAIYIGERSKKLLYDNMSSVNTFRVIFNTIFNEDFEVLKDSSYFSTYEKPYNFFNVTSEIID